MDKTFDMIVIGAGILGMATAMKLVSAHPRLRVAVVEKESGPALHQTGHNSGVIHSGIYYRPGSLKAKMCVSGSRQLVRFCREHGVPHDVCGKLVVASTPEEIPALRELLRRGMANGVEGLKLLDPSGARDYEPHVRCIEALHVPTTGIVDFGRVTKTYGDVLQAGGGELFYNCKVTAIHTGSGMVRLETTGGSFSAKGVINCGGLYSDRIARMAGVDPPCRIVPFRGEYYTIKPERRHLVKTLIYPVPDPRFPFLGVHFTRMIDGRVEAGPNAVLAWAREGYTRGRIVPCELGETLSYPGFWRLAKRCWKPGLDEMVRSFSKRRFAGALQRLVPEIRSDDLSPGGAGVRAQALAGDGSLLDDFAIVGDERTVHVLNAPSPAATSSLAIAEYILRAAAPLLAD